MDLLRSFIEFFSFSDPNVVYVVVGTLLIGASSSIVGCFTVLRKRSLVGDAIAHAVLPGVCLAFLLHGEKDPLILLLGAFISGWISIIVIDLIVENTRIKTDAALGIVLSVFFGLGILLLTHIQKTGNASQSGLDSFLFGKAASIVGADLYTFGAVAVLLMVAVFAFFREFTLISFDPNYAQSIGMPVKWYQLVLSSLTVLAVTVGIQAVGVVLMAALLITPAVAARFWTHRLWLMIVLAALIGAIANVSGAFISYAAPRMPTGPWIIVVLTFLAMFSMFFAPQRGFLSKWRKARSSKARIFEENVLKLLYQLEEKDGNKKVDRSIQEMLKRRDWKHSEVKAALKRLDRRALVTGQSENWRLSQEGRMEGQRIVRIHRLWELYLTTVMKVAPDHVHETAEVMEHIINPPLEKKLMRLLNKPERDPHDSPIPYAEDDI